VSPEPEARLAAETAYAEGPPKSVGLLLWRRFLRDRKSVV
jgi:hypothetical protein